LYFIASTKQTIIGAVLKRAFTVPAGRYLRGTKNIETVKALKMILFIMIVKTDFDKKKLLDGCLTSKSILL
jgi:hypothetical protein